MADMRAESGGSVREPTKADRLIAEQLARLSVPWQEQAAEIAAARASS